MRLFAQLASQQSAAYARTNLLLKTLRCRSLAVQRASSQVLSWSLFSVSWTRMWCGQDVARSTMPRVNSATAASFLEERARDAAEVSSALPSKTSAVLLVARIAALEQRAKRATQLHPLTTKLICSPTWVASWCGDHLDTALAVTRLCSHSALDAMRRILRHRLRSTNSTFAETTLVALRDFRRSPFDAGKRHRAEFQLRTLCYGTHYCTTQLRADLVRALCATDSVLKDRSGRCDYISEALWDLEGRCASDGLVASAPPAVLAPLLALLCFLRTLDGIGFEGKQAKRIRELCSLSSARFFGTADINPAVSQEMLARCAEDPLVQMELRKHGSDYQLQVHALLRVLRCGAAAPGRVSDELQYLKHLGAPVPRHAHLLIAGTRLSTLALSEVREDVYRSLNSPVLRRRAQLMELLMESDRLALEPSAVFPHSADCIQSARKRACAFALAAEAALENAREVGPWSFAACLARIVPSVKHQHIVNSRDDDPRPRPLSLLSSSLPSSEDSGEWLITFFRRSLYRGVVQVGCMPPRIRRSFVRAATADSSKVSKSWAPPCLHPRLEEPADVPHTGPSENDHAPLGMSRYFSWYPWQPETRFIREDMAQMEAMTETLEPQEYWIQYTGMLKKNAVRATKYLHQHQGHLAGQTKLSAFCSACSTDSQPVAALWCDCAFPKRARVRQVIRERWHLPTLYISTPEWRSGKHVAGLPCKTRYLQLVGPRWLPNPPDYPPRSELSQLRKEARNLRGPPFMYVACAGAWWSCQDNSLDPLPQDSLYLAPNAAALVLLTPIDPTKCMIRRRPLDSRYRRCDAERLMFNISTDSILYDMTTRFSLDMRKAHDTFVLHALPTHKQKFVSMYGKASAQEAIVGVCVGTSLAQPTPPVAPYDKDEEDATVRGFEYRTASLFEKHLLCVQPRKILLEKRNCRADQWVPEGKLAKTSMRGVLDVHHRAGLRLVGLRRATNFCFACKLWQEGPSGACRCCGRDIVERTCNRCGGASHLAVTTTHGAEVWVCGRCCTIDGMDADEGLRHEIFHLEDSGRLSVNNGETFGTVADCVPSAVRLRVSSLHPALSAAWAHVVETSLASPRHWLRSTHDGAALDTDLSQSDLQKLLIKMSPARLHLVNQQQSETYVKCASKKLLRNWSVLRLLDDWQAAADLQGMTHAIGKGSLLQQLIAPNSFTGTRAQTLECCARSGGGVVLL